jgi:hypothetical protein
MDRTEHIFLGWVIAVAVSASVQIYRVVSLKRKGRTWTEAFKSSNKLMSGNVWMDALLLLAVIFLVIGSLLLILWK